MPIKIYKMDPSPPSRAVLMTAEILKLNFEPQEVNLLAGENKTPEYQEKNPLHAIPLLEDGDLILAESHAIITYLVSKYGAEKRAKLYPGDLALRAIIDQRLYFDATILFPALRMMARGVLYEQASEIDPKGIAQAIEGYSVLEKYLEKTKFAACDHLTIADVSLVSTISSLNGVVPVDEKYVKLHAWFNTLKNEDWYQKSNVPGLNQLIHAFKTTLEKNRA